MDIYFDKISLGFFPEEYKAAYEAGAGWPEEMVLLSETQKSTYCGSTPPAGQKLSADGNGNPIFVDIVLTLEEAKKGKQDQIALQFKALAEADGIPIQLEEAHKLALVTSPLSPPTAGSTRFWGNVAIAQTAITFVNEQLIDVSTVEAYDVVNTPEWLT